MNIHVCDVKNTFSCSLFLHTSIVARRLLPWPDFSRYGIRWKCFFHVISKFDHDVHNNIMHGRSNENLINHPFKLCTSLDCLSIPSACGECKYSTSSYLLWTINYRSFLQPIRNGGKIVDYSNCKCISFVTRRK